MISWCNFLLCAFLLAVTANVVRKNEPYRLDIVHYNDFHDRFEETSVNYPICQSNDTSCLGGFARLYQEIHTLLKEKPGALLLNAGDTFQGTYWYTLLKWNVTQKFINMLPNDAHALGNHEFDDGVPGLAPYLKALKAPVLAANLLSSDDSGLKGLYQSHVVIKKKGRKIGIIGLITKTTELISNANGVKFLDPIPIVQKEAKLLTDKGVDIIVVLSHCGIHVDKQIAKEVGENIDVIVGGHTHSLLWDGVAPSKEKVYGPYPVLVETDSKPGHKVLIVMASAYTKYLGNMTVYFDDLGELQAFEGNPVFLNRSIPEDPEIKALLQPYTEKLHKIVNEVVGYTKGDLNRDVCPTGECAVGNLVADAFRKATDELHLSDLPSISFLQQSMIRSSISKGEITKASVINMSPFTNKVATFVIAGRYVLEALQMSLARPFSNNYTPQISGFKLKVNTTSTEVVEILLKQGDGYKPFNFDADYQVTTLDFLANGGNGLSMLKDHGRNLTVVGLDSDVITRYISKMSPITPYLDNRLTLVS